MLSVAINNDSSLDMVPLATRRAHGYRGDRNNDDGEEAEGAECERIRRTEIRTPARLGCVWLVAKKLHRPILTSVGRDVYQTARDRSSSVRMHLQCIS